MQLKFEDEELESLAYQLDFRVPRWPPDVTRSYRRVVNLIANAVDERDLRSLKGLRLEKLKGKRAGTSSVRINDQHRLVLRFEKANPGTVVVIIEAVDYH